MTHYFITGGSAGIGAAMVRQLCSSPKRNNKGLCKAPHDANIVSAIARRVDRLDDMSKTFSNFHGQACDVTDAAALANAINHAASAHGPIDTAILNAGIYQPQDGLNIDPAAFARHMDVNYMGVVNALAALIPTMVQRGSGHLVIISSVAGWRGLPKSAAYGPTKAALISLSESLYFELKPKGISIQVVCPGFVESEATAINDFDMPGLMSADAAATAIINAMAGDEFMPHFPKSFTRSMSMLRHLPDKLFFKIVGKRTGHL
jgi:NAD(P)-dependent dehydrogenase (short-subunit alcohol dehydrogenase family)